MYMETVYWCEDLLVECIKHPGENTICIDSKVCSDDMGNGMVDFDLDCEWDNFYTVPVQGHL